MNRLYSCPEGVDKLNLSKASCVKASKCHSTRMKSAWIDTELSVVIEVLTKCWESSQRAAVNSGELRKVTLLGGDICIEEEWTLFSFNGIGERVLLEEKQLLQKHMVESEECKGFRALDPESECLRTNRSSATYFPEVTHWLLTFKPLFFLYQKNPQ